MTSLIHRLTKTAVFAAGLVLTVTHMSAQEQYSWQKAHATVLPNGDLEWAPEPYRFAPGDEVRYIDYETGDDSAPGTSPEQAWKHHPWDKDAAGNAAAAAGPLTYVFKGGVVYRGQLMADESGEPGRPIRLLTDPEWGTGRALFWGSEKLPANWARATEVDAPERLPEPGKVWALDLAKVGIELAEDGVKYRIMHQFNEFSTLDPSYTALHLIGADGAITPMHLARTPDWQPMGEDFAMDYWHTTDAPFKPEGGPEGFKDDLWAGKDLPRDYFTGGFIWMGSRNLMGTPYPSPMTQTAGKTNVPYFHPAEGGILQPRIYGHGRGGLPYMVENLPQFLDAPGEFYLDYGTGLLFVRLDEGLDPNQAHLEFTTDLGTIQIFSQSHIEIGGLAFSFAQGNTIDLRDAVTDLKIHHNAFHHALDHAIQSDQMGSDEQDHLMTRIAINDNEFENIGTKAIMISGRRRWNEPKYRGRLEQLEILRNRTLNTGIRQRGKGSSNVAAITAKDVERAEVAGNIVLRSLGSGISVEGGKAGSVGHESAKQVDVPLIRIFVHHNKTEDTALGVNDYGGLALWQSGPTYAYSNNIGNSPGHIPAGFRGVHRKLNLSYPLYLDGGFKQYCFNNIIWGRTTDPDDPFANTTPGYWMVFGFLNQFTNNTLYRQAQGIGGSSGNRNDIVSNVFADISEYFIASNRIGSPSLVGGGDDASSGLRGIPSLVYARNLFQGSAQAGYLARDRELERSKFLTQKIEAATIEELSDQMQAFPIRIGTLGEKVEQSPIIGAPEGPITELTQDVDFHPTADSPAIDAGGRYFVPFSLYGTVGEWNFTENHADPAIVVDYHWWMGPEAYDRQMYEQVPSFDISLSQADAQVFAEGPTEDWAKSAVRFDGQRFGRVTDAEMRRDFQILIADLDASSKRDWPKPIAPWTVDEPSGPGGKYGENDFLTFPAELRKTLIIKTENLLMEAVFQSAPEGQGVIASKHDGQNGYALRINEIGAAEFLVSAGGTSASVATEKPVNGGQWHHVLAEIDRQTGAMTIYLDGQPAGSSQAGLQPDQSINTQADFLVAKGPEGTAQFQGALDFLRVCRGTLADSHTTIQELYTWQTQGPAHHDFAGKQPTGRRDAGALEAP